VWTQTEEELEIKMKVPGGRVSTRQAFVEITKTTLSVGVEGPGGLEQVLMDGTLFAEVEKDDCNWSIEADQGGEQHIWVYLTKKERTSGKGHWNCVVKGEPTIDVTKFGPIVDYIDDPDAMGEGKLNGFEEDLLS
jgi:hypothetical protein